MDVQALYQTTDAHHESRGLYFTHKIFLAEAD
jgi:hypothetical protein